MDALTMGLSVEVFWGLTPREYALHVRAENRRRREAQRRSAWLAWHIAALTRAKRMPSLTRMLGTDKARVLRGAELERRRQEHADLVARAVPPRGKRG